ncbi:hypothetical protein HUT17_05030 (plasmid) [Nocardiopsis flavescens]|nr:hypothetical protein HUT17_05030 [Nocardiopsis flavescens]
MDLHQTALLEEIAEIITEAPPTHAPAAYLHQRAEIAAGALRSLTAGEHPAEVLDALAEQLEQAAFPASPALPPGWRTPTTGLTDASRT